MNEKKDIIIVGAGISGLIAALELEKTDILLLFWRPQKELVVA